MPKSDTPKLGYQMPPAHLGPCVWYSHAGAEPAAAIITSVGDRAVSVSVFAPDARVAGARSGVRHVSDPELRNPNASESGSWDYTHSDKQLFSLLGDPGVA